MKIVINVCFGGFGLSKKAYSELGIPWDGYGYEYDEDRTNPKLVEVVEKLGEEAGDEFSRLEVIEIPDGVDWEIHNYDGRETVREKSRN